MKFSKGTIVHIYCTYILYIYTFDISEMIIDEKSFSIHGYMEAYNCYSLIIF